MWAEKAVSQSSYMLRVWEDQLKLLCQNNTRLFDRIQMITFCFILLPEVQNLLALGSEGHLRFYVRFLTRAGSILPSTLSALFPS